MNLTQLEFFFFPKESKEGSHGQLVLVVYKSNLGCSLAASNVCSAEKYTKRSSVLLLHLVYFSAEQTLISVADLVYS